MEKKHQIKDHNYLLFGQYRKNIFLRNDAYGILKVYMVSQLQRHCPNKFLYLSLLAQQFP
jgi:hypothetical protein